MQPEPGMEPQTELQLPKAMHIISVKLNVMQNNKVNTTS